MALFSKLVACLVAASSITAPLIIPSPSWANPNLPQHESADQWISLPRSISTGDYVEGAPSVVVIDLTRHRTIVIQTQNKVLTMVLDIPNGTGRERDGWPSPQGRFLVDHITWQPVFRSPLNGYEIAPYQTDQENPLGVVVIVLQGTRAALHGTNDPASIGIDSSHGCVRHRNGDVTKLATMTHSEMPVYVFKQISESSLVKSSDLYP